MPFCSMCCNSFCGTMGLKDFSVLFFYFSGMFLCLHCLWGRPFKSLVWSLTSFYLWNCLLDSKYDFHGSHFPGHNSNWLAISIHLPMETYESNER